MKSFFRLSAFLMILSLAVSCDPLGKTGKEKEEDGVVSVSLKKSYVTDAAGSLFVAVKASGEWTLSLDFGDSESDSGDAESWAGFGADGTDQTLSGKGDKANVILSYGRNTGGEARSLTIKLVSGSEESSCTLVQDTADSSSSVTEDGGIADASPFGWLELPETAADDGLKYIWHNMTVNGRRQRNYSLYWKQDDYLAIWVAYPLNSGLIGGGSRSDEWAFDPFLPESLQPAIVTGGFGYSGYDRGHQIPSADRYAGNSNEQTFYATNVTAQLSGFNQQVWAKLEGTVRDWSRKADTLYVVTGCVVGSGCGTIKDRGGHYLTVPSAYYKALLRYNSSQGYSGCAVWLDHKARSGSITRSDMMSIDALEEKLGIDLFVNLPAKVGETEAAAIEAKTPSENIWPI